MKTETVKILWSRRKALNNLGLTDAKGRKGYGHTPIGKQGSRRMRKNSMFKKGEIEIHELSAEALQKWIETGYRHDFTPVRAESIETKQGQEEEPAPLTLDLDKLTIPATKDMKIHELKKLAVMAGMPEKDLTVFRGRAGKLKLYNLLSR